MTLLNKVKQTLWISARLPCDLQPASMYAVELCASQDVEQPIVLRWHAQPSVTALTLRGLVLCFADYCSQAQPFGRYFDSADLRCTCQHSHKVDSTDNKFQELSNACLLACELVVTRSTAAVLLQPLSTWHNSSILKENVK